MRDSWRHHSISIRERLCRLCSQWKAHTSDNFRASHRNKFGLDTVCKSCAASAEAWRLTASYRKKRARRAINLKRRLTVLHRGVPNTWPIFDADRETILFLHHATSGWGQTEEGRAWLGR